MGSYADAGGVKQWYDTAGDDGDALLLLHGGLVGNDTWGMQMTFFAQHFRVFANERRAHGRTPDVDGPLTYEDMAADTIAFLEQVVGEPAHLVGWSDGGNVGLLIAIERPDLVRKLVTIGSNYHSEGLVGETDLQPDDPNLIMMRSMYEAASPDGPEHWPVMLGKVLEMWQNFGIDRARIERIEAPTLVMVGDDDATHLEHTIDLYRAIPKSALAVVPHASHLVPLEQADHVNATILRFLQNDPPATLWPIRRATS